MEVAALKREQLVQLAAPLLLVGGEDHRLDDGQALLLHEHVLGAAEADALSTEAPRQLGVARIVAVGPDLEPSGPVGPAQQLLEVAAPARNRAEVLATRAL